METSRSKVLARKAKRKVKDFEDTALKAKRAKREVKKEAADGGATTSTTMSTSLSALPDDVLIKIVNMLPKAQWASLEGVNHQFQRAASGAWRSVRKIRLDEDLVFKCSEVGANATVALECLIEKLLLRSPYINEITGFASVGNITAQQRNRFFRLLGQFPSLERISFANWEVLKDGFLRQCRRLGNIKELDISRPAYGFRSILDLRSDTLKLERLWCRDAPSKTLCVASASLTTLSLTGTSINPRKLLKLVRANDRLERLDFDARYFYGSQDVSKQSRTYVELFHTVTNLASKNLSILKIGDVEHTFTHGLRPKLVRLLEECGRYRRLKELSLAGSIIKTQVVDVIASNLKDLTSLSLTMRISNDRSTASLVNLMTKLTQLQKLTFVVDNRCFLDDTVLAALATNLIELKSLDLDCNFLPPANLENLALLSKLKKLRINAECVDNDVLTAWSNGFGSNLESLSMIGRPREGHLRGLSSLIEKASGLRLLNLGRARITDRHLRIIASSCPILQEFYVWRKNSFTEQGVQAVIDGCRYLKWLQIKQRVCPGVWDAGWNVGKYRKVNFRERGIKTPFGGDE